MITMIKEILTAIVWLCSCLSTIAAAVVLISKPVRKAVKRNEAEDDGIKCLLRSDMLRTYYRCQETGKIRQFEYENFMREYKAYKALDGNTFVDHIKEEVENLEVISA